MIRFVIIRTVATAVIWAALKNWAHAGVLGDFESGTLTGWRLDLPLLRQTQQTMGNAAAVHSWTSRFASSRSLAPVAGDYFVALGTGSGATRRDNRNYNITLQQRLWLTESDSLSGWAAFFNGDNMGLDSAWVKIFGPDGRQLATPWLEQSGSLPERDGNSTAYRTCTDWSRWEWQAPESGQFTLMLGMTTCADDRLASYGFFDNILVSPAAVTVPEPTAISLLGITAVALGVNRRKLFAAR